MQPGIDEQRLAGDMTRGCVMAYPTNGITGVTEAEGADNLTHNAICDDAIVDRRKVPKIILDWAAIKRLELPRAFRQTDLSFVEFSG